MSETDAATELDALVDWIVRHAGPHLVVAAPLGLGKPHHLINALYRRVADDPSLSLHLLTALSLTPPDASSDMERRFVEPMVSRLYGDDFERLLHVDAQRRNALPDNITVEEFYLQSGLLAGSRVAQRHYVSLNYTHVARAVAARGVNVLVQWTARSPDDDRLSLSCNPDLTFDLLDEVERQGRPRPRLVTVVHPELPWLGGDAAVPPEFFDRVATMSGPPPRLFALPRRPVGDAEHAIGLHASRLVRDGGTLQIGIGALCDGLCRALVLRQDDNATYRTILAALDADVPCADVCEDWGGEDRFERGLFGASEMITDGFQHLVEAGVIARPVVDDIGLMQRDLEGTTSEADRERLRREGNILQAAFYIGSSDFYAWLRELPVALRNAIGMTRVSRINQFYGGSEALEKLQRRDARFFNTAMMMSVLGAATSDALADGTVISGVGGQYNFVAMAHALDDGRSVLMLRSTRESGGTLRSNIVWNYAHTTIPRHLRDIVVTEYGVADLRGRSDEDCIKAMLAITDARFQGELIEKAKQAGKLADDFRAPEAWSRNRPEELGRRLAPFRNPDQLPDYPLGSDFTAVEQRLVVALGWLKSHTSSTTGKLRTTLQALGARPGGKQDTEALDRMGLARPAGFRQRMGARLLALALQRTRR